MQPDLGVLEQKGVPMQFDEIGYWSEVKLDIVKDYARAYSTIFHAQKQHRFFHVYIDAFAGAGVHLSKKRGEIVPGSPLNAVNTNPPFREYHLIDLNGDKVEHLRGLLGDRPEVHIHHGDCNRVMLEEVLPKVKFEAFRRGLCLLDPYGLHLNWEVICTAGRSNAIDLFLNFPIMDMNRNVFWQHPEGVDAGDVERMNAFWGDESWRKVAYKSVKTLFGDVEEKANNESIARAFQQRLREAGGFAFVPEPVPMKNSTGAVVYYLYFASQKPVAKNIVTAIFKKYRERGVC